MKLINENLFEQHRNMRIEIKDPNIHASGKYIRILMRPKTLSFSTIILSQIILLGKMNEKDYIVIISHKNNIQINVHEEKKTIIIKKLQ